MRVVPRLVGTYDGGIHKTIVYGVVDAEFFDLQQRRREMWGLRALTKRCGIWSLISTAITRERHPFSTARYNFNNGAIGPPGTPTGTIPIVINPFGTTPTVNPIAYNQFTAGGSVTKTFNQAFATLGVTAFYILFDQPTDIPEPFQTSEDGASIWVTGRVGYNVIPQLLRVCRGRWDFSTFRQLSVQHDGYQVMGGLGTKDPNSLIRGEIYGGYQAQQQLTEAEFGTPSIPLLRPRASRPLSAAVFLVAVFLIIRPSTGRLLGRSTKSLGISTQLSPGVPEGLPSKVTTALVQTTYALAHNWWVGARGGYTQGYYLRAVPAK